MKTIKVSGAIVPNDDKWIYDWLEYEATCPKDVEKALNEANGEEVTLLINSGGGDIGAGNEIAYHVSQYKGYTVADIAGYCCSSATLPACAAKKARMSPSALYMIHNVSSYARGDHQTFTHEAGVLKTASEAISMTYQQKTGKSENELLKMMDKETWLNATQAKEYGFIDEIIGENQMQRLQLANATPGTLLSKETIEKLRNQIKNPNGDSGEQQINPQNNTDSDFLLRKNTALANINLLRMKGEF